MFFYTDVEITADANIETANTVRFLPTGGKNRERR
jgi:hypothetical protein